MILLFNFSEKNKSLKFYSIGPSSLKVIFYSYSTKAHRQGCIRRRPGTSGFLPSERNEKELVAGQCNFFLRTIVQEKDLKF